MIFCLGFSALHFLERLCPLNIFYSFFKKIKFIYASGFILCDDIISDCKAHGLVGSGAIHHPCGACDCPSGNGAQTGDIHCTCTIFASCCFIWITVFCAIGDFGSIDESI